MQQKLIISYTSAFSKTLNFLSSLSYHSFWQQNIQKQPLVSGYEISY